MQSDLILLVEDNSEILDSVASILQVNGFEVIATSAAEEALAILEDSLPRMPDLIVSDIRMPGMDGYEFLDAVRNEEQLRNIPFIFLTALGDDHHVVYGWDKGIDGYIIKPFQPERLVAAVRNRIKRSKETQVLAEKQLERTRHALLQVLSHELRTPLTYVMGGMSLLEEDLMDINPGAYEHIIKVIYSGTSRLFRLAEQTSVLGELVSGYATAHWEQLSQPVVIGGVVQEALEMVNTLAEQRQVTFNIAPYPEIRVFGIQAMLVKGIYEILNNAVQYSDEGGVVNVSVYRENGRVLIHIEDTGRGILPQDIDKVWKLMIQSQREKFEHQGLGLGLTLAKGIFEVHGGDARIESVHGQGTHVWLELPLVDA